MPKTAFVSFAFILVFCLAASVAEAGFFEERLQVIDNKYQDEVFGGDNQQELIITFTPGDDLTYDAGEPTGVEGDWAIIVDADDDGDFNDDTVIAIGNAVSGSAVTYRLHRNSLSHLPDGRYEVAVVIDNLANGRLDWEGEVTSRETLSLLFRIKDEYQITLVDFILALDNGEVPAGLRQEFVSNGILLFLSVIVEEPGSEWLIADQDRIYPVRKNVDEDRLDVYEFDFSVGLEFQDDLDNVFIAGSGYESQLDSGILPQGLRNEFSSKGITLSGNITVNVIDPGEKWTITDNDSGDKYVATKRDSSLNINAAISLPGISGNATILVEKSGSRWFIIDGSDTYVVRQELDRIKVYELLASVNLEFQAELDNGIISDELQQDLETEGIVFDVTVQDITDYVNEPELRRWRITTTSGRIYVVQFDNTGEHEGGVDNDELEIYSEDVLLFVVRTGFGHISELLDMDIIPAVLRLEFEKNGIMLLETATVEVQDPGSAWLITGSTYAVRKEGDKLNVYEYSSVTKSDKADDDTEDFTLDRTLEITELVVDPQVFSPNGDGVRDTVTIYYTLSESLSVSREEISITIGEGQLTSPARPRPSSREGRNSVVWEGKDGLGKVVADGIYTVKIQANDRGGNEATETIQVEVGTEMPEVATTEPAKYSYVSALTQVRAQLQDNSGEGLDLTASRIRLKDASGKQIPGTQRDDGANVVTWLIQPPLPGDGSADGEYIIVVTTVDKAGNSETTDYPFFYDTVFPKIVAVIPADGSVLDEPPSVVEVVMNDGKGSGPNLGTTAQTMILRLDGNVVNGSTIHNGVDSVVFIPFKELEIGIYTIQITPTDFAGNKPSEPLQFQFTLVEDLKDILPGVVSTEPRERSAVNRISQVSAVLEDNSGKGIDIKKSTISLVHPSGVEVPGVQTDDGSSTIIWELTSPLPTNGSADGRYIIKVKAVDKANRTNDLNFTFTYDTKVPAIMSIAPADRSILTTPPTQVVMTVSDGTGSGVDFDASLSSMSLSGVEGNRILREANGVDTMTFSFPALEDTGRYTIEVTLRDKAGNEYIYSSRFDLVEKPTDVLPEVVSTDPPSRAYVNALTQVSAVLKDNSGKGISLDASSIRLEDPSGVEVAGVQTDDDASTIVWELISPLPADGSVDGRYTIVVNAVDKTGGVTEYTSTFLYDTRVPLIASITPADGSILTTSPTRVVMKVSDGTGSGVDFAASLSSMSLSGVEGNRILREANGVDTMTFSFPALEDTGRYTVEVTLRDKAGNEYIYSSRFDLVEKPTDVLPEVVSTSPPSRAYVNALTQVSAVLKDNSGKGISLDASSIRLEDPSGVEVSGVQTDDDSSTIVWELISPLPADGSVDGTYTIVVNAADKTGGVTEYTSSFLYDTLLPSVVATTPAANDAFYEGISQVTIQLDDGDGSGVDLSGTGVELQGPTGNVQVARSDNGKDTITLTFSKLTESGNYVIQIDPRDRAGNSGYPVKVKFSYVLKPPAVKSVTLTNRAYVSSLESIEAVLEDRSGIGLDLSETGSSIVVTGPGGVLQADQTSVGEDTIIWQPVHPLAKDGTDDGEYKVTVTPMDTVGISGQSRNYTLIYDTQPPEVVSATPVDVNADVTHVGQQLSFIQARLQDEGPADIQIEDQVIYLEAPDAAQVPGVQTDNDVDTVNWSLTNPLAKDGTADGIYSVVVEAIDRAGNAKEFRYPLAYDTLAPTVVEVSPKNNSLLSKNIMQVWARLEDTGDGEIDFGSSGIELRKPDGSIMAGLLSNDGVGTLTFTFAGLEENGVYTMLVAAVDKAGNGAETRWKTEFVFKTGLPVVYSTTPITDSPDRAFVNTQLTEVRIRFRETDGGGIDLSPTGSEIKLKGPDGNLIIGSQTNSGADTLIFRLSRPRATDGTEDGEYTILVMGVNAAKRRYDREEEFKFIYDTQVPAVASISHLNVNAEISYVHDQITDLEATLKDKGPAGIDVDRSSIKLIDPSGQVVNADASDNEVDTLKLEFPAGLPLEGSFTLEINAVDKARNSTTVRTAFIYAVSLPKVVSTTPITVPAKNAFTNAQIKDVRAELSETGNSGIDLSPTGSTIRLKGPKGDVPGVQSNSSNNVLIFTLTNPLATDGSDDGVYTILVTPVNAAKLKGQPVEFSFTYDTVAPEVDVDDITIGLTVDAGSSLSDMSAIVKDEEPSSGIDWENADSSWIKLRDSSGRDIPGRVIITPDESRITLLLDVPLASNGGDDGFYSITVVPKDKAGNSPEPKSYEFLYDTRPPTVSKAEITINEKPLLLDSSLKEYPTAVNTKGGVTIVARMEDEGAGVDLTLSSIKVTGPGDSDKAVSGSLKQNGVDTIWLTSGLLNDEGRYKVEINPVDLDGNGINTSSETIFTEFLFEQQKPRVTLTEPTADEEAEDEPIRLRGTATDESGGEGDQRVEASGVARVEIGGTGPGDVRLDWVQAIDDSDADQKPWSKWYLDFLPDVSGTYDMEIRVWDNAGNSEVYDAGIELTFTVELSFQEAAYCWPNPVTSGVAHISFKVNVPEGQTVPVTLFIYDVSGDLVYEEEHKDIPSMARTSVPWDCINNKGEKVITGIYLFRLEAELPDGQKANKVGKPMIIKN